MIVVFLLWREARASRPYSRAGVAALISFFVAAEVKNSLPTAICNSR